MSRIIDSYLKASGIKDTTSYLIEFEKIKSSIPPLNNDNKKAILQIKDALFNNGFKYDFETFKADEIITKKVGNCLGLPLFISAILAEYRESPKFKVLTSILDGGYDDENNIILPQILENTKYDHPILATEWNENLFYRFFPLQHMVIDSNGGFCIETTMGGDDVAPEAESSESIDFIQALSCVYKDRATKAFNDHDFDDCKKCLEEGKKLWPENRELIALEANIAYSDMDDIGFEHALNNYNDIGGDDSLFYFVRYSNAYQVNDLEKVLHKDPACAEAIANKAVLELERDDKRDARYSFSVASQLQAMCCLPDVDLADFYSSYSHALAKAFGNDIVLDILKKFEDYKWGEFDYHLAVYLLSGDHCHLLEAKESAKYNLDWVQIYLCMDCRKNDIPKDIYNRVKPHLDKKLINKAKRDLSLT